MLTAVLIFCVLLCWSLQLVEHGHRDGEGFKIFAGMLILMAGGAVFWVYALCSKLVLSLS
ncbi:MAG: hypothetical protein H7Y22_17720 [Gemmatimonadaceae bacterium]|nr:hypothetical protein [Gloeobacterales cyanobacterium ES-bin-141]